MLKFVKPQNILIVDESRNDTVRMKKVQSKDVYNIKELPSFSFPLFFFSLIDDT